MAALGWYLLKNHHQESVVKTFVDALRKGDYQSAYRDWGCTPQKPCSAYSFDSFMSDWGAGAKNNTRPIRACSASPTANPATPACF